RWPAVFTSDDRGRTWRETRTMPVAGAAPAAVEGHPHDRDTMFVGVNSVLDPTYRGRVLVTTDGGAHWDVLPGRDAQINHLSLHPDGEVLAVADGADPCLGGPPETVRLTNDRGATWVELP